MENIKNWFNSRKRDLITGLLLFLVGTLCFGLGYLYAKETQVTPIVIEKNSTN